MPHRARSADGVNGGGYSTWDGATPGGTKTEQKELGQWTAKVF